MTRQSISFTDPNSEWLDRKVNGEGEYKSNSDAVNDLIRKAREIEAIQATLIQAEQSGITELSRDEMRAEIRNKKGIAARWRTIGSAAMRKKICDVGVNADDVQGNSDRDRVSLCDVDSGGTAAGLSAHVRTSSPCGN